LIEGAGDAAQQFSRKMKVGHRVCPLFVHRFAFFGRLLQIIGAKNLKKMWVEHTQASQFSAK
jgi:hypothetical protein